MISLICCLLKWIQINGCGGMQPSCCLDTNYNWQLFRVQMPKENKTELNFCEDLLVIVARSQLNV
jgi:hypothetical protein